MKRSRHALAATVLSVPLLLAACSVSIGSSDDASLSASALEDDVRETLADNAGDRPAPDVVDCEGGVEAEVDAEQRCVFATETGTRYGLSVIVTEVDGSDLTYDIEVDPGQVVAPADLEPEVTRKLTELAGVAPDDLDCPDDLPGYVDAATTCVLTAGTDRLEVTVTVTEAQEADVAFDIEVAEEPLP